MICSETFHFENSTLVKHFTCKDLTTVSVNWRWHLFAMSSKLLRVHMIRKLLSDRPGHWTFILLLPSAVISKSMDQDLSMPGFVFTRNHTSFKLTQSVKYVIHSEQRILNSVQTHHISPWFTTLDLHVCTTNWTGVPSPVSERTKRSNVPWVRRCSSVVGPS
jgi:hypothetical protein